MKVKQIARLLALILTLVTMVSCLAVFMATDTSAAKGSGYVVYTGKQLHANNQYGGITHKSDNGDNSWTFTSASNDPTIQIDGLLSADGLGTNVLKYYPYIVIRYQTTSFTSMQIFYRSAGGQDFRNAAMPVAPVAAGKWGVLFYDFKQSFKNDIDWFRLDPCTDSGVTMTIAEIAFFTTQDGAQTYANVYASAGTGNSVSVMNAGNFSYNNLVNGGAVTGYTSTGGASGSYVSNIFEMSFVHNDHYIATKDSAGNWTRHDGATSQAFTKDGAVFTRITASGNDAWLDYRGTNNIFVSGFRNHKKFAVRYRIPDKNINNQSQSLSGVSMQIYYASNGGYTGAQVQSKSLTSDNQWHWVFFDFSSVSRSSYDSIRFDFMTKAGSLDVAEIYFYDNDYDVYNAVVGSAPISRSFTNCYPCGGTCKESANLVTNPIHYFLHKSDSNVYFTSVGTVPGGSLAGKHRSSTGSSFVYGSSSISTVGRTFYIREGTHSAHNSSEKVSTTAATCTAAPTKTTQCSLCGDNRQTTTTGSALGHQETTLAAKDPTCTTTGLEAGTHCTRCNTDTVKQTEIPALGHNITSIPKVDSTYTTVGHEAGSKCSRCSDATVQGKEIAKKNPLLSYNVALNEKFAVNMTYVAFDGATIAVVDESGTAYTFTATNTGKTHTDGLPIWSIRIADISARDIGHTFTVSESLSGYSSDVSVDGYCGQVDQMCAGKTEADLTNYYMSEAGGNYTESRAQALAKKALLAHDTTQKITVYGQAAENYFNPGNTTDKHTALAGQIANYAPQNTTKAASNTGLVKFKSATVLYGDEIELVFIMDNYNREKIFVNNEEIPGNKINDHLFKTTVDGKEYICFAIAVKPDQFSETFTVRAGTWVMGEDGNDYYAGGSTASYSVDTYIASMQQKYAGKSDAQSLSTVNLVNALGNYGLSASTYVNN